MTHSKDTFELLIRTENAAFDDEQVYQAVADILREVAFYFEQHQGNGVIADINGNNVGGFWWTGRSEQ
jgi:hypothetical protein